MSNVRVDARHGESFFVLMKRFKKACDDASISRDAKRASEFTKPSDVKRRARMKIRRERLRRRKLEKQHGGPQGADKDKDKKKNSFYSNNSSGLW